MTSFHPNLLLKRLIIYSKGVAAYDKTFHPGVNIIRGDNAHGKSTIADFIFYALGGDQNIWKQEALDCDTVVAEAQINGADIVLRRYISEDSRQPLQIFWGSMDQASSQTLDGWEMYPYSRSANKESFSQRIFRAMDLPLIRGMEGDAITMHQLLRLIYVDQISPYDSLLRTEAFDSNLKRESIGDLMLGLYDRGIHDNQIELQQKTRELDAARIEIKALERVLSELGIRVDTIQIEKERMETETVLQRINSEIDEVSSAEFYSHHVKSGISELAMQHLVDLRKQHSQLFERLQSVKFDIEDSKQFIKDLDSRIASIQDSITTRRSLGQIVLEFCPVCLAPITEHKDSSTCGLCKCDVKSGALDARALRMLSELEMQKDESTELLSEKTAESKRISRDLKGLEERILAAQVESDNILESKRSSRDSKLDALFQERGATSEKLKNLFQGMRSARILKDSQARVRELERAIDDLKFSIQENKKKQAVKASTANAMISDIALTMLRADNVEGTFQTAEKVDLDWRHNTFAIDERNNFSASSVIFARNAVHFAIFFASLKLDFMRFPRFILCDCMEDKGMKPERSARFQNIVAELSKKSEMEHQIIFTTSMISPSLDGEEYCIGEDYRDGHKTLDLPAADASYHQQTIL